MQITRRRFLTASAAGLSSMAVGHPATAQRRRPNVVLIMADDIGFECYGAYGSTHYKTPRFDKLCRTGTRFDQAYSQPLCTPSRVRIMTGKYNIRNYQKFNVLDLNEPTFATMLQDEGYHTCVAGKWQLTPSDLQGPFTAGFDEYLLWHFMALGKDDDDDDFNSRGSRYKSPKFYRNGKRLPDEDTAGGYGPDLATDFICDFMERNAEEPFFVYYPMILTHDPFEPTPASPEWDEGGKANRYFKDMVERMDHCVGRIVDQLDALGLRENTLLIVTGDNGTNQKITSPFPGRGEIRGGKGLTTDAGTRVGFVANWPGVIPEGHVCDAPIDFADILPTIAEVTDATPPPGVDGDSILPLMKGEDDEGRGWVFIDYSRNGPEVNPWHCFVRDERWKLYPNGQLFDVPNDWLEERPAEGPEADAARARLKPILDRILDGVPMVDRSIAPPKEKTHSGKT